LDGYTANAFFSFRFFWFTASDEMVVPGSQIYNNNSAAVYIQWLAYMMDMPDSVALYCTIQPERARLVYIAIVLCALFGRRDANASALMET
jgi:hypothetical protein